MAFAAADWIAQTSWPDSTRSLLTGYLDLCDEHLSAQTFLDFRGGCTFKEQLQRFAKVVPGHLDGVALARNIQFRAKGNEPLSFAVNNCRQAPAHMSSRASCGFLGRQVGLSAIDRYYHSPNEDFTEEANGWASESEFLRFLWPWW